MTIDLKRFTISALVCTFIGNVQAADIVGQIDYFNCVPDVYSLTRDGQSLAVKFFTQLQKGDKVIINTDKNTLSLELIYKDTLRVEHQTPPYKLDNAPPLSVEEVKATCPLEAYSFKRDGKRLPIQPTLLVGDQIVVNKATPTIHLKLDDNEVVKVNYENSPYTVKSKGKVSTIAGNLLAWFSQVVTDWHEEELKTTVATVSTKGVGDVPPEISAPYTHLLKKYNARNLVAGTRPLYLAWGGGKAPYQLTIKSVGKAAPIILKGIQKKRIKTQDFSLTAGNYDLQIKDADNRTADYIFSVVESKPAYPKELLDTSVSETTRLTAQAIWLATQNRKKWVFEAYQQIAALAERYPPARVVRNALEQRASIPRLPKK
jgi:hypothetical protein